MLPTELKTAYENTDFYIFAPEIFIIRPNELCSRADAFLQSVKNDTGTVLTAYNPMSVATDEMANRAAQLMLRSKLDNLGFEYIDAEGCGRDTDWPPEPSIFVIGLPFLLANQLAGEFRQAAFAEISLRKTCRIIETKLL